MLWKKKNSADKGKKNTTVKEFLASEEQFAR